MPGQQSGSRRTSARFVTVWSGGRADTATPSVPKWRFRASAVRRGSGERPRANSPRPCAESDLDMVNRYVVFQDAARDGATIDGIRRDATDRRWLAGPAPALPSTGATPSAKPARTSGQRGGSVDWNERERPAGGEARGSRGGGPCACTGRIEAPQPSATRIALAATWPAVAPTSTIFCSDAILARDNRTAV